MNETNTPSRKPVLLVEDYPPNVLVARTCIEDCGYECDVATSGRAALEMIRTRNYALVFMDIQMPGMDGLEVTRFIRQDEQEGGLPRLPVVAMTAHALAGDRERCLQLGMDAYLSKPFQIDDLRRILETFAGC